MPKLARVEHQRCDHGTVAVTYVWVPEGVTEEEFSALVELAKKTYFDAEAAYRNNPDAPKPPGYEPNYRAYPDDMTLGQVRANHAHETIVWSDWQAKKKAARRTFAQILQEIACGPLSPLKQFHEYEPALSVECHWGHNHGMDIQYGETEFHDFNEPEDAKS